MSSDQDGDEIRIDLDGRMLDCDSFTITLTNSIPEQYGDDLWVPQEIVTSTFTAQFAVDRDTYDRIAGGTQDTYTVSVTRGGPPPDPALERPRTLRALLHQMRDIIVWEFKRAALMHPPVVTVTVPDCHLVNEF